MTMIYLDITLEEFFEDKQDMKEIVVNFCKDNNYDYKKIKPIITTKSFGVLIDPPRESPFIGTPRGESKKRILSRVNPCI